MTKKQFVFWTLGLALLALLVGGCAKAPTAEVEAAQAALAEAEAAGAADYAPEAWQAAQTSLNAAQAKIEEQNGKMGLMRSYDEATALLTQATTEATAARDAAVTGKEAAKSAGEAALVMVTQSVADAQTLLGDLDRCPRKPKGFAVDLAELRGKVESLGLQAADAEAALGAEKYLEAKTAAETVQAEAATLTADLQGALGKLGCPSSVPVATASTES